MGSAVNNYYIEITRTTIKCALVNMDMTRDPVLLGVSYSSYCPLATDDCFFTPIVMYISNSYTSSTKCV